MEGSNCYPKNASCSSDAQSYHQSGWECQNIIAGIQLIINRIST